jgi:hypothetical protein
VNSDPKVKPFEDLANRASATFLPASSTGGEVLRPRLAGVMRLWANNLFEASWANFRLAQRVLKALRKHPHPAGAVLREQHQA